MYLNYNYKAVFFELRKYQKLRDPLFRCGELHVLLLSKQGFCKLLFYNIIRLYLKTKMSSKVHAAFVHCYWNSEHYIIFYSNFVFTLIGYSFYNTDILKHINILIAFFYGTVCIKHRASYYVAELRALLQRSMRHALKEFVWGINVPWNTKLSGNVFLFIFCS